MPDPDDAIRQEQRKKAGDFLKMADKLFKGSDYEGAVRLVQLAMQTDPHNPYAVAYMERIKFAIEQRESKREPPSSTGAAPPSAIAPPESTSVPPRTVPSGMAQRPAVPAPAGVPPLQQRKTEPTVTPPPPARRDTIPPRSTVT